MIPIFFVFIFLALMLIYMELSSIKKAKLVELQMMAEANGWDDAKVNAIADKAIKKK
ncbi:hypothetical protein [Alteromonas macleodii]|uniref:Uncharacterized protein n=1 Tax=Alteromonas macleodii TaxID=28108 RepID=A0AB36FP39_ALTMA|nr:hypothetical protein [Alteromonas macleodii]OES24166.1 hypothetical protein BFV93_4766 [Alteromonas macleodii]OES24800.1 hypothetical protein BFV95_4559 [Alteromonas macleodii]OES25078.1 hypothetical protein BFV94_4549 [Alteromonas macleodii]OES39121.1 hypothetical protein BFV96_4269 [Alteromonas macleodii]